MTDEMTMQGQRPSAVPYLLGGALIGGAGGAAAAKYANIGIPGKVYSSWEEAVKATGNDEFISKQIEKAEGDVKTAWETVKTQQKNVQEAESAVTKVLPEEVGKTSEAKEYFSKLETFDKKKESVIKDIEGKITKGEITTVEGVEGISKDLKGDDLTKKAKEVFEKDSKYNAEALKSEKEAVDNALEKLKDKAKELKKDLAEDFVEKIKNAKANAETAKNKAKEVLKEDLLAKCKAPSMLYTAGLGAAILGLAGLLLRPSSKD